LYVKFDGFYYEQSFTYFSDKYDNYDGKNNPVTLDRDFSEKLNLKNIVQCGIYDILIFKYNNVRIFNNINP
jgi:hypothetical protein